MSGNASALWALTAYAGMFVALGSFVRPGRLRLIACVLAVLVAVPVGWVFRGVFGDPSYVTGVLAWWVAARRCGLFGSGPLSPMSVPSAFLIFSVWVALVLSSVFPMPFDLYFPGIEHPIPVACAALFSAVWSVRAGHALAAATPCAVLLSLMGAHESRNAWDWYWDPFLTLMAVVVLIIAGLKRFKSRRAETV